MSSVPEKPLADADEHRVTTVARTETGQAFGYANHEALQIMLELGVIDGRTWLADQDDRGQPTLAELHSYTIHFDVHCPGEIRPEQEINCECTETRVMV